MSQVNNAEYTLQKMCLMKTRPVCTSSLLCQLIRCADWCDSVQPTGYLLCACSYDITDNPMIIINDTGHGKNDTKSFLLINRKKILSFFFFFFFFFVFGFLNFFS